ncbi:MAG: hypothetical protein AAGG68_12855 [Bacteroidota bacterium]
MTLEAKKLSIIKQILAIEEESVLDAIFGELEQGTAYNGSLLQEEEVSYQTAPNVIETTNNEDEEKLDFRDAVVEIRENVTFEDLIKEQNYKPITYSEIRKITDEIDWGDVSLEELLEALD